MVLQLCCSFLYLTIMVAVFDTAESAPTLLFKEVLALRLMGSREFHNREFHNLLLAAWRGRSAPGATGQPRATPGATRQQTDGGGDGMVRVAVYTLCCLLCARVLSVEVSEQMNA